MRRLFPILLALTFCSKEKVPVPEPVTPASERDYQETKDRLSRFLDQDYVISRQPDGTPDHLGDSLIWQGMSLYALRCDDGKRQAVAVRDMMLRLGGGLSRHPSMPDDISMDGALGTYLGVSRRLRDCGEGDFWAEPFQKHKDLGKLNPHSDEAWPKGFDYVRDSLFARLGIGAEPSSESKATMEAAVVTWATGTALRHEACYRIHLGLIAFQASEVLGGKISDPARAGFCEATKDLGLPTVDRWCGRDGLLAYLESFKYNEWEFRHQRCLAWESPDGGGLETPAVDRLVALRDQYDIGK